METSAGPPGSGPGPTPSGRASARRLPGRPHGDGGGRGRRPARPLSVSGSATGGRGSGHPRRSPRPLSGALPLARATPGPPLASSSEVPAERPVPLQELISSLGGGKLPVQLPLAQQRGQDNPAGFETAARQRAGGVRTRHRPKEEEDPNVSFPERPLQVKQQTCPAGVRDAVGEHSPRLSPRGVRKGKGQLPYT